MRLLDPALDLEGFFARVSSAPERILLLDYDGTLAPFHVDPARARPYPKPALRLRALARQATTRIVIVSGRPLVSLRALIEELEPHEAWGTHGWEHASASSPVREFDPGQEAMQELAEAEVC